MKIAFLNCTNGLIYRGVETFVHELANSLSKNNDVIVYQAGQKLEGSKYKTETVGFNFKISEENRLRSLSKPLYMDFGIRNLIRRFYFDYWNRSQGFFAIKALQKIPKDTNILIIPGSGWASLFCRIWTSLNGVKLVIAGQSGPGWDDRVNLWCRPDVFVALSGLAYDWAKKAGFGVRVEMIPNGVDIQKFNAKIKPVKIDLPRPIFLAVAALEVGKRLDLTIKAVSMLKKGSLVVLGDGQEKNNLLTLAEEILPGRFALDYVKCDQMPAYYTACDVVTMAPVSVEAFGIVYVEAMAANKPVVAADDPIRREIIKAAGIFVNPKNIEEYAKGLQEALNRDWNDIPRKQAEKFSWDTIAKKYENLF